VDRRTQADIYQTAREMVELEDRFIDLAFEMGPVAGITAEETKQYIRFIADRRLLQLGLKPNYGQKDNPFEWLDEMMTAVTHTNFFEGRATEYSKGGVVGWNADDVGFPRSYGPARQDRSQAGRRLHQGLLSVLRSVESGANET
jgi:ribonucleotide reductase beta subunit family protein with ferritin-like domain